MDKGGKPGRSGRFAAQIAAMLIVTAVILTLLAQAAQATTLEKLSLEQLAERATTIVLARTTSTVSEVARPGGSGSSGFLQTRANAQVLRVLKGSPGATVSVTVPGGRMAGITAAVDGMPEFASGETSLLFLDEKQRVIGGTQGKLAVVDGIVESLRRPLASVEAQIAGSSGQTRTPEVSGSGPSSSSDLSAEHSIRTLPRSVVDSSMAAEAQAILPLTFTDGFETGISAWTRYGSPTWDRETYRRLPDPTPRIALAASTRRPLRTRPTSTPG